MSEKKRNIYIENDNYIELVITNRKGEKHSVYFDKEDFETVNKMSWTVFYNRANDSYYARNLKNRIFMHRLITKCPDGLFVDHINHNTLDNRKSSLRICTHKENTQNRKGSNKNNISGIRGVSWAVRQKSWRACLYINGSNKSLGYFKDIKDAEKAVNRAIKENNYFTKEAV